MREVAGLEAYIQKSGQAMRLGYTTGSCAALAARAAAQMLLTQKPVARATLLTPKGITIETEVLKATLSPTLARCAVKKDAGDDPDVTDGALVFALVTYTGGGRILIDGGQGVGRVTRKGLDQPVGAAAINSTPRRMISAQVAAVCEQHGYDGGLSVIISVPEGEELAARTFNPKLGIIGGISIIGTSGIVEPMSTQALLDTIDAEMSMLWAEGTTEIILTPGNYGRDFLGRHAFLDRIPAVKCSNFMGEALDMARQHGFSTVLVVGHIGKLVKLAGGIMNTHSKVAGARMELLALHTALAGGAVPLLRQILACLTCDEALALLQDAGLQQGVMHSLLAAMEHALAERAGGAFAVGALTFSARYGELGHTAGAAQIMEHWRGTDG